MRFNVRDAVQSAASIVEGQLAGQQAALDQLQLQQQAAINNRLRLFQYGQEGENANKKVLADLLPNVDPTTQGGILNTINQPSRYSPEALMKPGPLDLSQAPSGAPTPPGAMPASGPTSTRSLFGNNPYSGPNGASTIGAETPGTSASPAIPSDSSSPLAGVMQALPGPVRGADVAAASPANQVQGYNRSIGAFLQSPLGDSLGRGVLDLRGGNDPFLAMAMAKGTPAGGGNTAPPFAGSPSGSAEGGPQGPDAKQGKLANPLQPATAPGQVPHDFYAPYQKPAAPPTPPPPAGGPTGAPTPGGVPFTYYGANGPQQGTYTGGQQSIQEQIQQAHQDQARLVAGLRGNVQPGSELAKAVEANKAALYGPIRTPADLQQFYTAYQAVAPLTGEDTDQKRTHDKEITQQDDAMVRSMQTFLGQNIQSPAQLEQRRAEWRAFRDDPQNKEFFDRHPTWKTVEFPATFAAYKAPVDKTTEEKRKVDLRRAQAAERWEKINRQETTDIRNLDILLKRQQFNQRQGKAGQSTGNATLDYNRSIAPWKTRFAGAQERLKQLQSKGYSLGSALEAVHGGYATDEDRTMVDALHAVDAARNLLSAQQKRLRNRAERRPYDEGITKAEEQALYAYSQELKGATK